MIREILFIPIMLLFIIGFVVIGIYSNLSKNEIILSVYIDDALEFVEVHNVLCAAVNTILWIILIQILL